MPSHSAGYPEARSRQGSCDAVLTICKMVFGLCEQKQRDAVTFLQPRTLGEAPGVGEDIEKSEDRCKTRVQRLYSHGRYAFANIALLWLPVGIRPLPVSVRKGLLGPE